MAITDNVDTWDQDHLVDLLHINGQRLHLDMTQAESVDFDISRNVEETEVDGVLHRTFTDDIATLTYTVRVKNSGLQWVAP